LSTAAAAAAAARQTLKILLLFFTFYDFSVKKMFLAKKKIQFFLE
jgi:hypothetical protein